MKALIRVTRKTEYASIVEITEEKFKELSDLFNKGGTPEREASEEINKLIDVKDWQDDSLDSIDEFERYVS